MRNLRLLFRILGSRHLFMSDQAPGLGDDLDCHLVYFRTHQPGARTTCALSGRKSVDTEGWFEHGHSPSNTLWYLNDSEVCGCDMDSKFRHRLLATDFQS